MTTPDTDRPAALSEYRMLLETVAQKDGGGASITHITRRNPLASLLESQLMMI